MVALRVVARYAWATGVPAALREAGASGGAFPFAVLTGTLPTATATAASKKASRTT